MWCNRMLVNGSTTNFERLEAYAQYLHGQAATSRAWQNQLQIVRVGVDPTFSLDYAFTENMDNGGYLG